MVHPAEDIFRHAAELHRTDPRREGNVVHLPPEKRLLVAGDLHGHRRNLARLLGEQSANGGILILQEIIHGPVDPASNTDRSVEVMLRAARATVNAPDTLVHLMGNHNVAQITGNEIAKSGRGILADFTAGVAHCFPDHTEAILSAVEEFCRSLPLAARTDSGVFLAHSLPAPKRMDRAGTDILHRENRSDDYRRGGAVYEWTWGRNQTPELLDQLAEQLNVEFFLLGHRHIETGWEPVPQRGAVLNTDSQGGCVIDLPPRTVPDLSTVEQFIRPASSL